ncbi:MAG: translocation/assembly module TamB domain-containing protein [Vitreimonas sp.]
MSEEHDISPAPEPKRRRLRRRWIACAAGGALVVTAVVVALGPGAPWLIDRIDGQRIWRLGRIDVDGVAGAWLGALRAEHVSIADEDGVWIEARDVSIDWRPQDILFGAVRIDRARAATIAVLRRPTLLERRPSGDVDFDVRIGDVRVDTISVAEPVFGEAATFTARFSLDLREQSLQGLELDLQRTDSDADHFVALYRPDEDYALQLDALGAPGGILARALGVPEQGVRATASGAGDMHTGQASYSASIGDAPWLAGAAGWTPERWSTEARAQLDLLPQLRTLARRIGSSVELNASGERVGAFTARAETPFLAVDLSGELDEEHRLTGPARFTATTQRVSDIAREAPFTLGPARLEGELRRARGTTAIRGTLHAEEIDALGQRTSLSGPVQAALTAERFVLTGDLRAPANAPALFAGARLSTALEYDRGRQRFELQRAEIAGDAIGVDAQGWVNGGDGEFSGAWRVRRLGAFSRDLTGEASGHWRAFAERRGQTRVWTTSVQGSGARIGGAPAIVPQLLGAAPRFDGRFTYENRGITVSHARLDGAKLRAGATGRIVSGQANLALEASARGPLDIGGAQIAGALDATGRITGRLARPALNARASLSSFTAGGVAVSQPVVTFTLAPSGRGYAGRADVQGSVADKPLTAAANVAMASGALTLSNLDGQVAGMRAQGSASFDPRGVTAVLDVDGALDGLAPGVTGRMTGDVQLAPNRVVVDAHIADAASGDLRIRAATLRAEGPFDAIAARFDMRGRLRHAPLAFEGTGLVDASGETTEVLIEGRGTLAGADIFTRAPIQARLEGGRTQASLNVAIGDGAVSAQWEERGRALSGSAQIEDAPLAPLAAIWGERAEGRIDGRVTLANSGGGLNGEADVMLRNTRFAGRQSGRLDMHIVGDLDPSRLRATVDASSTEGLTARFVADAPVVTSANPIRIALAPERRGRATWSVQGPAESLWAAARLQDQTLSGQLDGEGELEFGAGYLSGDGHIEIVDGRFEDKLSGVTLVDLDARVAIDRRGVTIENFTASGPRGGRLTATGGSANQREGRIAVTVHDMRIVDRPDARARANGELALAWEGLNSTLTGDLNVAEAEIDIAANPEAGIPTLEVVEINRPDDEDFGEIQLEQRTASATELDVRIRAPGRVVTRGRGVDAEWSLDLRLQGTARDPRLSGEARSVRGTLALSGQPFELDDARIVFDGDPMDAEIDLTARRDTADLTAYIHLTGTARDPEVTFTSDPALPEDEILPHVLFGRSVEDLSGLEAAQLAASLASLSGRASLDLMGAARAAVGLDRFNVRQDAAGGFLVAGGVYLTRDVYLEVARTGLGQAQTRIEWTVRPRLVLITSFLGDGEQRVSLRWRRESD